MSSWIHVILQVSLLRLLFGKTDTADCLGHLSRMTFAKSHSKQAYYDARKSSWGDLFPHTPKGKEVMRDRGVRRLTPLMSDMGGVEGVASGSSQWPTAELEVEDQEAMTGNEERSRAASPSGNGMMSRSFGSQGERSGSGRRGTMREKRSRREIHTSAIRRSVHPPPTPVVPEPCMSPFDILSDQMESQLMTSKPAGPSQSHNS